MWVIKHIHTSLTGNFFSVGSGFMLQNGALNQNLTFSCMESLSPLGKLFAPQKAAAIIPEY